MFTKKTVKDFNIKDQIVLVRTDYNVPIEDGKITSDLRVQASLPTIEYLLEQGAKRIILMSHLGRPDGEKKPELSLEPVAELLAELLPGHAVDFVDDVSGPEVEEAAKALPDGGILLLENLRFSPAEEQNSEDFAREIVDSLHPDLFVQDGFAVVHRAHASTDAITNLVPSCAGLLLQKEIDTLSRICSNPEKPFTVVIGGAKVEDKQPLIDTFADVADHIAVGGKIAADGYQTDLANVYVAEDFDEDSDGHKLDVGPLSTGKIVEMARASKTVVWNGCLGKTEDPAFATASTILAKTLGEDPAITSVICGGDTTGFVESLTEEYPELHFTLVSTGGGAALEFLTGKTLPGLAALEDK